MSNELFEEFSKFKRRFVESFLIQDPLEIMNHLNSVYKYYYCLQQIKLYYFY